MFEQNTFVSAASMTTATYSGSPSLGFNWYDGGPSDGVDLNILVASVIGNPQVLFMVQGLNADGTTWIPIATDPLGPCNTVGMRNIHFAMPPNSAVNQFRLIAIPNALPGGIGSGNSSSISAQSFSASSAGGVTQQMIFSYGLATTWTGS